MKKTKIPLLGMYIITFLIACVITFLVSACNGRTPWSKPEPIEAQSDSILVAQYIDRVINPEFLTVKEIFEYRDKVLENAQVDSIILSLPENILTNVATVVLNKFGTATKRQIYDEYRANNDVYKNLPNSTASKSDNTATNTQVEDAQTGAEGSPKESTVSYNFRDSVIDGKKARVETKVITYD